MMQRSESFGSVDAKWTTAVIRKTKRYECVSLRCLQQRRPIALQALITSAVLSLSSSESSAGPAVCCGSAGAGCFEIMLTS
ncbi:hypothetical protein DIPPA_34728 [Diplonema papillatum]|nr:hypothetical protein DIPPA_34728 [Diplonema papillatum]